MFNATELFVILNSYDILTTRFGLVVVLLIVNVSQIIWLSGQIFGISKPALDFVRDGYDGYFASQMKMLKKCNFLTTPPLEKSLVQEILHLGNL